MSKVLIIGGGGMIGQKLAAHLSSNGLGGGAVPEVTLFDLVFPEFGAPAAERIQGSLADSTTAARIAALRPDVIFHLAAIVSGEAEKDFDKGWAINMSGTWNLLEALRVEHEASVGTFRPRLVFSSSIAVFGGPYPEKIDDFFLSAPQTSYGAQKAISELMIADYSRKGFVDGISIRLPTICVRPGKPNLAASSFFSSIIREPLNGKKAILPVSTSVRHWHASPRGAVGFLTHAAQLDHSRLGGRRSLNMPGVSCTVEEQIEALRLIAGKEVADLIQLEIDPEIAGIVDGWPRNFQPDRAIELGFSAEADFAEIIRVYIEDDLT